MKLKIRFPYFPQDSLRKIYRCRLERMKTLTRLGLPEDVRWIIEAKVRLAGEFQDFLVKHMPGMGKSSYSKKRRAKRMGVCHKCARWNCDARCKGKGMISINREDKIQFLKDGLSKESLDNILQTLETHPSGDVHRVLLALANLFDREKERHRFEDLMSEDPICQFIKKLDEQQIHDS